MHGYNKIYILLLISIVLLCQCSKKQTSTSQKATFSFSQDSAYKFVAEQLAFGTRQPGSAGHRECVNYLYEKLNIYCDEAFVQQGDMLNYEGGQQRVVNITGRINPHKKSRVLLCAHYDTRPWADQAENYADRMMPILGANDGASGVAVLLEVARQLACVNDTTHGIDIVFFDCEDMGTPDFYTGKQRDNTWCLGSQMWSYRYAQLKAKSQAPYYQYGILLDMVGAYDAVFPKEYYSALYANAYVEKVWQKAQQLGYANMFVEQRSYPITDDHYYLNTIAKIPTVDVIHYDSQGETGFPHWWHTANDNLQAINPATLCAVGNVVLTTVLN